MKKSAKPTIYIIHGWTYTTKPWDQTIALLKKRGIKVEMLNVPGLTASSKKVWTIAEYVKWANRKIPDGAIALGHSNGGRILLNLCSENPEKLKQLILLDAAGVYEPSKKRDLARKVSKYLGFLKKIPGLAKVWHKLTGASDYARAPENMKKTLTNMLESDKNLKLSRVNTPTTILWGENDTVTPPRQAEVMHRELKNSTLELFPGWTHAPYISSPEELAQAIDRAISHPPVIAVPDDVTATSAALALKAPEPVLSSKSGSNSVAPDLPTKLVLLNNDSKLTKGMVISDEEGAAVRYNHKKPKIASKSTDVNAISASTNLRKAQSRVAPDLDAAAASASSSLKKSKGLMAEDSKQRSAAMVLDKTHRMNAPEQPRSIIKELEQDTVGEVGFVPLATEQLNEGKLPAGSITSASVPKVGRLEQAKRKVKGSKKGQK